jgi:hypothetical protein
VEETPSTQEETPEEPEQTEETPPVTGESEEYVTIEDTPAEAN